MPQPARPKAFVPGAEVAARSRVPRLTQVSVDKLCRGQEPPLTITACNPSADSVIPTIVAPSLSNRRWLGCSSKGPKR